MIYFVQAVKSKAIKIGVTNDPAKRLMQLQTGSHEPLVLLGTIPGDYTEESRLHRQFAPYRIHGEWFRSDDQFMAEIQRLITPILRGLNFAIFIGAIRIGKLSEGLFCWELPNDSNKWGADCLLLRFGIRERLTASDPLRDACEALLDRGLEDGESFDITSLFGRGCLIRRDSALGAIDFLPVPHGLTFEGTHKEFFIYDGDGAFHPPCWLPFFEGKPVVDLIARHREATPRWPATPRLTAPSGIWGPAPCR